MDRVCIAVDPGICGFGCQVQARRTGRQAAVVEIAGSECKLVRKLAENIKEITLHDVFTPQTQNPVFKAAERAGCHLSCPIPVAVLKAAEVALDLALPHEARISFVQCKEKDSS